MEEIWAQLSASNQLRFRYSASPNRAHPFSTQPPSSGSGSGVLSLEPCATAGGEQEWEARQAPRALLVERSRRGSCYFTAARSKQAPSLVLRTNKWPLL